MYTITLGKNNNVASDSYSTSPNYSLGDLITFTCIINVHLNEKTPESIGVS